MLDPLDRERLPDPANDNQRRAEAQAAMMALDLAAIASHLDAIIDELWARDAARLSGAALRTRISPHLQSARRLCIAARLR